MTASYSPLAKAFHWLTALAILCVVPLGLAMVSASPGPDQNRLYDLHRSFGALILTLTALRLMWRLYAAPPAFVGGLPAWQGRAAKATHAGLYVLLFTVPILGWAGTSAFGARIEVFGLFELPMIIEKNRELAGPLLQVHGYLAFTLCALFFIHVSAALFHHFIQKDETLRRMLPHVGRD